jgi:hypothetical protein
MPIQHCPDSCGKAESHSSIMLSTRTGNTGGLTDSNFQLNKNSAAAPQMRPWHGPIPQRVCSFAARHDSEDCNRSNVTSFTSAHNRVRRCQLLKFTSQFKRTIQCSRKLSLFVSRWKQRHAPTSLHQQLQVLRSRLRLTTTPVHQYL